MVRYEYFFQPLKKTLKCVTFHTTPFPFTAITDNCKKKNLHLLNHWLGYLNVKADREANTTLVFYWLIMQFAVAGCFVAALHLLLEAHSSFGVATTSEYTHLR